MQFLKAQRESLWIGGQVHEWLECMAALGYWQNIYDTKRDCFPLSFKWNSHCTLQMRHQRPLLNSCYAGGFQVDISFPLRCFAFSLGLLTSWLWNKGFILFCTSDRKQYCLWGVRENLSGEQDVLLSCCGLCGSLCAKGWWGVLLFWLLLQG